jgi:iron complex outermembrane receptor protein
MNRIIRAAACALACAAAAFAQTPPRTSETIEVTATKIAEDVITVPAAITVIDGDELRARNATTLAAALAMTAGVDAPEGGDQGPAGSMTEMWGLKEADAFLLVVDGVPWGGAFNPDLPTLDLTDVDRIEVLRGSAPVMYGATSFIGVIHVIHRDPGAPGIGRVSAGSYGSGSVAASIPLSQTPALRQSITANAERRRFRYDATGYDRLHALYRLGATVAGGTFRFDADAARVNQDPNSPHPRVGTLLTPLVPVDANHNPHDARIDEDRIHLVAGFDTKLAGSPWTTTLAFSHSKFDIVRGFLATVANVDGNAAGFTQDRGVTEVYFDSHIARTFSPALTVIGGVDHLFGRARANSGTFEYFTPLAGHTAETSSGAEEGEAFLMRDRRNFSGVYATAQWTPLQRLRFDLGARLNHTTERRDAAGPDGSDSDSRSNTKLAGSAGAEFTLLSRGRDALAVFADYRNTFKPAAIDFGPEAEADILRPETAISYEVGLKGRLFDRRLSWTTSAFRMDFHNLVLATTVNGLPALQNSGNQKFTGAETEVEYEFAGNVRTRFGYSYHDARFADYVEQFSSGPTQLAGKRLEMSPFNIASGGIVIAPEHGFNANAIVRYIGGRMMNKRNTAPTSGYTTWSAGVGYRAGHGELHVDGRNLNNVRPPVAESELGEGQYYILPARAVEVSYRYFF